MSDLIIRDNLRVLYFTRSGFSSPFFALREFDMKILRAPVNRDKGSLKVQGISEQAIRARITQVIMKLKLLPVKGLKSEVRVLKQRGILGKRAPKCSLLIAEDMVNLLRSFGRESHANDLDAAVRRLKEKAGKLSDTPSLRKDCIGKVKRSLSFKSTRSIKSSSFFPEPSPKRIKTNNLAWTRGSMCSLRRSISNKTELEKGVEVTQPTDPIAADTLSFNFPSIPTSQPSDYFPPRRTKNRIFPLKNSSRMDLFSSLPPPPRTVPLPTEDENQFSVDALSLPLTSITRSKNLNISITTNKTLSIPSPVFSPPPPLLSFNFDVYNFSPVATRQDFNDYSTKLNSPLYNPIEVSNLLEDEERFESEEDSSNFGNIGSPDSISSSETDAYLETCQSLQPIAQLS